MFKKKCKSCIFFLTPASETTICSGKIYCSIHSIVGAGANSLTLNRSCYRPLNNFCRPRHRSFSKIPWRVLLSVHYPHLSICNSCHKYIPNGCSPVRHSSLFFTGANRVLCPAIGGITTATIKALTCFWISVLWPEIQTTRLASGRWLTGATRMVL